MACGCDYNDAVEDQHHLKQLGDFRRLHLLIQDPGFSVLAISRVNGAANQFTRFSNAPVPALAVYHSLRCPLGLTG